MLRIQVYGEGVRKVRDGETGEAIRLTEKQWRWVQAHGGVRVTPESAGAFGSVDAIRRALPATITRPRRKRRLR